LQPEWLTVSHFAELAGVTTQAVYKRMKTDLKPFINPVGNVKTINAEALKFFELYEPEPLPTEITNQNDDIIILLKSQLEMHLKQNEEQAAQIRSLLDHIKILDEEKAEFKRLATIEPEPQQLVAPESKQKWWQFWKKD